MSQVNNRDGYCASDKIRDLADQLVLAVQAEAHPGHTYVIVPAAMFEVFMGYLRIGATPNNREASEMVARGAVSALEGISASSHTSFAANFQMFQRSLRDWALEAVSNPTVEVVSRTGPRKDAG